MHTSGVGGPVNFRVTSQQGNEERAELLTEELNRLIEAIPNASTYYGRIQPFNPTAGTFWVDTENNTLRIYDGTGWTHIAVLNTAINQPPYANAEVVSEERFTADETKRGRKLILED